MLDKKKLDENFKKYDYNGFCIYKIHASGYCVYDEKTKTIYLRLSQEEQQDRLNKAMNF